MYILYYNFYNISNYFLLMEYEVGVEPTRNGVAVRSPAVSISYIMVFLYKKHLKYAEHSIETLSSCGISIVYLLAEFEPLTMA